MFQVYRTSIPIAGKHYLLLRRSPGVMLALYASELDAYLQEVLRNFKDIDLPSQRLQMDVRGKTTIFQDQVTVEVGEMERDTKEFQKAKQQPRQRALLMQWALSAASTNLKKFLLIRHVFVPRSEKDLPGSAMEDPITIKLMLCTMTPSTAVFSMRLE